MTISEAFKNSWRNYAIEAWCLGTFMVSACVFGVLLYHSASPVAKLSDASKNTLMGLAMGATALGIITSPWGKRSGAHFNPAVTLTFLRLGKIGRTDAVFYIISHFLGGLVGVVISWLFLGEWLADSMVNFVATVPGRLGGTAAFIAEVVISFVMMLTILVASHSARFVRLTPFFAGTLLAIYIIFESPISGTSLNPARTFATAVISGNWTGWWIYFVAPPIAMLAAGEVFIRTRLSGGVVLDNSRTPLINELSA